MKSLPKNEETILLAIWKLKDKAFGITIIEQVEKDTGTKWLPGSIYGTLTRLKNSGCIATYEVGQRPGQIGRPRIYYRVTPKGMKKLISAQKAVRNIWGDIPDLEKI